jgi:ribosomal protein L37AE/L43A
MRRKNMSQVKIACPQCDVKNKFAKAPDKEWKCGACKATNKFDGLVLKPLTTLTPVEEEPSASYQGEYTADGKPLDDLNRFSPDFPRKMMNGLPHISAEGKWWVDTYATGSYPIPCEVVDDL